MPDGGAASSLTTFTEGELDDDELLRLAAERLPESQIAPGLHAVTASELQMLGDCTPASQPDFEAEAQELLADAGGVLVQSCNGKTGHLGIWFRILMTVLTTRGG